MTNLEYIKKASTNDYNIAELFLAAVNDIDNIGGDFCTNTCPQKYNNQCMLADENKDVDCPHTDIEMLVFWLNKNHK